MKTKTLFNGLAISSLLLVSATAQVTVTSVTTNGLNEPYSVVVDSENNLYISDGANNRIVKMDASSQAQTALAGIAADPAGSNDGPAYLAHFNNPQGLLLATVGGVTGLVVADYGNHLIRFVRLSDGFVSTLAGQLSGGPFLYPVGMDQDTSGNVYVADFGNNAIRVFNLSNPSVVNNVTISGTSLYRPTAVAFVSPNQIWVADTGNQMVKLLTLTSATTATLTSVLGGYRSVGTADSSFGANARFNGPSGLLWLQGIGLLISDELNNSVRLATNYTAFGATNYAVTTFAGTPGQAGLVDGSALSAKLNSPVGLAIDPQNNGFVLADLKNNAIRRIQTGPALPPVPEPKLGWVLFVKDGFGDYVSQLQVGQYFIFNNDVIIAILGTDGAETHFTFGPTPPNPLNDTIPNPTATVGSTPGLYRDGVHANEVPPSIILPQPDVTIKAIGFQSGRRSSAISSARFRFRVAAPLIQGNNAALFTVTDQTIGAQMWYTIDGSDPTNSAPSIGPITASGDGVSLSINAPTNFTFKIRGFRDSFEPSEIASQDFSATNFTANKITFGFAAGEASSDFVGSPGQFFYAPVTLSLLPGAQIYSLQFSLTASNSFCLGGICTTSPPITPGAFGFESTLEKPIPGVVPPEFERIPPLAYDDGYLNPPPDWGIVIYDNKRFVNMVFTNSSNNLLGVGWLERFGRTNLYDTTKQDLIKYSQPHDTLFDEENGQVVLGGYAFQIPATANAGDKYQIQIARPSATSDGVGGPGREVYIATPTNGSLAGGTINATKVVTVGQRKYVVGDSAPFRWYNAGDFGNTNLDNSDVMQVFQSAIYGLDNPPDGSDFFDVMDSCGGLYTNAGKGYLEFAGAITQPDQLNPLFGGDDTTINQIAFGDGVLDVCDLYVTFRRSLDPSLPWFRRFWTNGVRGAEVIGNPPQPQALASLPATNPPSVAFSMADAQASAGDVLQIPVSARISGNYRMRVLSLNLSLKPLEGSPAVSTPILFTPNPALGQPSLSSSRGNGNYAASWLNSGSVGLAGDVTLGTLSVRVPTNATSGSSYALRFEHASASPNGLASFPKKTQTALVTLSDRSGSTFNDGIPDSWRLRYFGSIDNLLSQANADADGDGANNRQEYVAGTDPTDAKSCLKVASTARQSQESVIRWPSVSGKTYVIERSASPFTSSWSAIATNVGTGTDLEYHDLNGGKVRYYRVRIAQ